MTTFRAACVKLQPLLVALALVSSLCIRQAIGDVTAGTADGSEVWGYTDVRPGAHLFWWLYYSGESKPIRDLASEPPANEKPLIMWLQGGPGASGVGYGNFEELGPLTLDLQPRKTTWLKAAHLLFVDNPVGAGYSYVDDNSKLTTSNGQIIADLIVLLRKFFSTHSALQSAPFFVFCESYGGKYTSELAVAIHEGVANKTLKTNFRGVAMGDSWISPIDFMKAWGPQLRTLSLVDDLGEEIVNRYADKAVVAIAEGRWADATTLWAEQEEAISELTDHVDFYNILRHNVADLDSSSIFASQLAAHVNGHLASVTPDSMDVARGETSSLAYTSRHLSQQGAATWKLASRHMARLHKNTLNAVMNGPIKEKLGIIPANVSWGFASSAVFVALYADFMRPTIDKVDRMLDLGVNVTIFSGQLDLICCTDGTLNWMKALRWQGMEAFQKATRQALYCPGKPSVTAAFVKQYANLAFYWIMNAGHMVPADNGCMALKMVEMVTGQA